MNESIELRSGTLSSDALFQDGQGVLVNNPTREVLTNLCPVCCAVTHHFKMDKARRELHYHPVAYPMSQTTEWFLQHGYGAHATATAVAAAAGPDDREQQQRPGALVQTLAGVLMALLVLLVAARTAQFLAAHVGA